MSFCYARRDTAAAPRVFEKAFAGRATPKPVTADLSGASRAALQALNAPRVIPLEIRQNKVLNTLVEQDHRAIKRRVRPRLGFQNFRGARLVLGGTQIMPRMRKAQRLARKGHRACPAEPRYALAA